MTDFKNTEIIEAYLDGELSGDEQKQLERTLEEDKELAEKVLNAKGATAAIRLAGKQQLKLKLQEIHDEEISTQKQFALRPFLKYAAIFIAIASIATVSWYTFFSQNQYSDLYSQNFTAYTNLLTVKGQNSSESLQALVNTAMHQYDSKNYADANKSFKNLLAYKQDNDTILFYYGISSLGAGQVDEAISLFSKLLEKHESLFYRFGHAKWYLALAHLNKAGEIQKQDKDTNKVELEKELARSKKLLQEIVAENGDFSSSAKEILKKLE